ncbi:Lnb N-terminal periplasmic domain-containing protein [Vibrio salinus]|uniref:Lnb N-terminal periplasmic domain-containing protein n=1 Tax=Vibrio salinus TaxID=2899784 RepID=UPI001E40B795|nr:DUF4105 domain-containing protein [Vibrio salinus]MCE0492660.1 DUF4105 domain-containing protein [Vibrio salinus]
MKFDRFFSALLTFCFIFPLYSHASETSFDTHSLSQDAYWLKLGHYLKGHFGNYTSTVDSKTFFLSPDGKSNPEKELKATIQAFYQGNPKENHQAICTFPARYHWLEELRGNKNITLNCPELQKWQKVIEPNKLTLVFPTAFMNNPSSMFGHTLLRIDAKNQNKNSELVAFAVNFAANPDTNDNAALYAMKGLIGSYPGRFTVMPYYKKVREYNDIESRDIWEYPLNFTTTEVNRILLHLWELEQAEFDYYFLDENCSYQLLALLQLANHDLDLVDDFPVTAIPSDTVKTLVKAGLTQPPKYREAFGTRLLHESDHVSERIYLATKKLKEEGIYPSDKEFTDSERAAILEFAYEWLNFELYDDGLERNSTAKRLTKILIARSRINAKSPFPPVPTPQTSPDQGHGSARIGIARNQYQHRQNTTSFEWRPSYHDLFDAQSGFIPGAQISFLDTKVNIDDNGHSELDHFYFMDALALAPSNRVFDSLGWGVKIGFDRPDATNESRLFIKGGAGKAWGQADHLHVYWLFEAELNQGQLTDHDFTLGVGAKSGLLYSLTTQHRIGIEAEWISLIDGITDDHSSIKGTWNWSLSTNTALRTEIGYSKWHEEEMNAQVTAYFYY